MSVANDHTPNSIHTSGVRGFLTISILLLDTSGGTHRPTPSQI